jgi:hypothetical protein
MPRTQQDWQFGCRAAWRCKPSTNKSNDKPLLAVTTQHAVSCGRKLNNQSTATANKPEVRMWDAPATFARGRVPLLLTSLEGGGGHRNKHVVGEHVAGVVVMPVHSKQRWGPG